MLQNPECALQTARQREKHVRKLAAKINEINFYSSFKFIVQREREKMANDFKSGASQSSASGHGTVQTAMGRDAGAESGFDSKTSGDTSAAGMGMTQGRPTRINDALQVLDDALASQNSMGLKQIVTDEFQNLKHAISELAPKVSGQIKTAGSQVYDRASELASSGLETRANDGGPNRRKCPAESLAGYWRHRGCNFCFWIYVRSFGSRLISAARSLCGGGYKQPATER